MQENTTYSKSIMEVATIINSCYADGHWTVPAYIAGKEICTARFNLSSLFLVETNELAKLLLSETMELTK